MAAPAKPAPTANDDSVLVQVLAAVARRIADHAPLPLPPGIDWDQLLHLASVHGLEAFLFQEIRSRSITAPPQVMQRLGVASAEIAARNLTLGRETLNLASLLQSRGLPHLVYKGPLLGEILYGTQSLRPSHDIDLIVRPEHAKRALELLKGSGYIDSLQLTSGQLQAAIYYGAEYSVAKQGIEVDLHWRPAPKVLSASLDVDGIWSRATTLPLFNAQLPTLAPEDLFLLLCLHAGEHAWAHLSMFADMAKLLIVADAFDWDIVRAHLRDESTCRAVDVTLLLLVSQFGAKVPPEMLRREAQVEIIAAQVISKFWPSPESAPHMETSLRWVLERSHGESLPARLRWISGCIMAPTLSDIRRFQLPLALRFLYPGLRFLRLAFRTDRKSEVIGTST